MFTPCDGVCSTTVPCDSTDATSFGFHAPSPPNPNDTTAPPAATVAPGRFDENPTPDAPRNTTTPATPTTAAAGTDPATSAADSNRHAIHRDADDHPAGTSHVLESGTTSITARSLTAVPAGHDPNATDPDGPDDSASCL